MTTPLRLGIVGCGDIAGYVAMFARLNRRIRLAACCDISGERAATFARRFRIPRHFTRYEELTEESGLDAVYLAVPHHLHAEMLQRAIEAGLPVFVEKPLTCTLEQGLEVVRQAQSAGVRVGVNYQYRYDRGCYALARAVQAGELGEIHFARLNLPWRRTPLYFQDSPWHARQDQACGGTLITQGSHLLDIILWAIGGRAHQVAGFTARRHFVDIEVEDLAQAIIEMDRGALVQVSSAMVAQPQNALRIEVYGEHGTAVYTDRPWPQVRFQGLRLRPEHVPVGGLHALQRSLEGFRSWLVEDRPYLCPVEAALPALAVVEAVYRSARSGRREPVSAWDPLPVRSDVRA